MRTLRVLLVVLLHPMAIGAQDRAPEPPPPAATGLVVGSENLFSPIVASLERALAFYRDGVGLQAASAPSNPDMDAPLRQLFGLPDAHLRWVVARPPAMPSGIEIIEIRGTPARPLGRGSRTRSLHAAGHGHRCRRRDAAHAQRSEAPSSPALEDR